MKFNEVFEQIRNYHLSIRCDYPNNTKHYTIAFKSGKSKWCEQLVLGSNYSLLNNLPNIHNTIHSEHDGMRKLFKLNKRKRILSRTDKIDLLVIRITKTGIIGYSRPCRNCLLRLSRINFNIRLIYYSINNSDVRCEKLSEMIESPLTRISSGYRFLDRFFNRSSNNRNKKNRRIINYAKHA